MLGFAWRKGGGRRTARRAAAELPAELTAGSQSRRAILADVSCNGAGLRGEDLPEAGEDFLLKIGFVQLFATVVWSDGDQCGVRFQTPLTEGLVELIREEARLASLVPLTPEERLALEDWRGSRAPEPGRR